MTLAVDVVSASFPVPLWGKGEMALTVNTIKPDNKKPANCLIPPPFYPQYKSSLNSCSGDKYVYSAQYLAYG